MKRILLLIVLLILVTISLSSCRMGSTGGVVVLTGDNGRSPNPSQGITHGCLCDFGGDTDEIWIACPDSIKAGDRVTIQFSR